MTNYFASSLLDAMGQVLHLHTCTCQYLDRETGGLMWPVDSLHDLSLRDQRPET